ncbi:MAG TPA: hypothetical protein VFW71_06625 [Actinomycetota bacterium]|nr:hypothetical protein [Actinomycetota bacterium]
MNRRRAAAGLLVALALCGAGCSPKAALGPEPTGSVPQLSESPSAVLAPSDSGPPTESAGPVPTSTLSRPAFLVQANAICATRNAEQSALPAPTTEAQILQDLRQAIAIAQSAVAKLRALPEPPADRASLQADFAKVDTFVASAQREVDAIQAGNTAQASQLDAQTQQLSNAADEAFNAYGMTVCGQG